MYDFEQTNGRKKTTTIKNVRLLIGSSKENVLCTNQSLNQHCQSSFYERVPMQSSYSTLRFYTLVFWPFSQKVVTVNSDKR